MAQVTLHEALALLRGKFGNVVFKKINGKLFATSRAEPKPGKKKRRTPNQLAWQARFKLVSDFAHAARHNPAHVAFYAPLAKKRGCGLRQMILSDGFSPPEIHSVDFSRYTGKAGSGFTMHVTDNVGVAQVWAQFKRGRHHWQADHAVLKGRRWHIITRRDAPDEAGVELHLVARDRTHSATLHRYTWPGLELISRDPPRQRTTR
jgi:hypothetical protein